jgi:N-acetylmuramoyl-L-alanine amidase
LPPSGQVLGASSYNFTLNLSLGSSGNDVTELQKRLTAEGVYTGPITGYFGPLTGAGVKAYQLKYGIAQLGIVGPATRAKLNQGTGAVLGAQTSTMTTGQLKALLAQLQAQVAALLLKLNSLPR